MGPNRELFRLQAVAITFLSGMSAALGGMIVVCFGVPSPRALAHLLSFASGIMLYMSYADLLKHAIDDMQAALNDELPCLGPMTCENDMARVPGNAFFTATGFMLLGMLLWGFIALALPSGEDGPAHGHGHGGESRAVALEGKGESVPASAHKAAPCKGGASHSNLVPALEAAAPVPALKAAAPVRSAAANKRILFTGLAAALGVSLHNLPEGLLVYNNAVVEGVCNGAEAAASGWRRALGLPDDLSRCLGRSTAIAAAIGLHNIPEGMAVASPIYAATGSAWTAMAYTLLSSAAEPVAGVVMGYFWDVKGKLLLAKLNAGVAGIMIALCIGELMPAAVESASAKVGWPPAPPSRARARAHTHIHAHTHAHSHSVTNIRR